MESSVGIAKVPAQAEKEPFSSPSEKYKNLLPSVHLGRSIFSEIKGNRRLEWMVRVAVVIMDRTNEHFATQTIWF